jgi:hypothetical protein
VETRILLCLGVEALCEAGVVTSEAASERRVEAAGAAEVRAEGAIGMLAGTAAIGAAEETEENSLLRLSCWA